MFLLTLLLFLGIDPIWRMSDERELAQTPKKRPPQHILESPSTRKQITKEYFRCKGSSLHLPRIVLQGTKEVGRFYDCQGAEKHSLPIRDGSEFIYPILIDLLNEIQEQTGMPVIITSGHRCPTHHAYIDSRPKAQNSKHMLGAEVDFYVQGMQEKPLQIVQIICNYYKSHPTEYQTFQRYEKTTDVSLVPWYNKEIFIKVYQKTEGRNFDNRHPYPYINLQVRFDREKNERVIFCPKKAEQYLRK